MKDKIKSLASAGRSFHNSIYRPEFYRLTSHSDKTAFEKLLESNPCILVFDEIQGQLEELVKSINPRIKFTKEELQAAAVKHLGVVPSEEYGVWVYYPWSNRVVHILDEEEFIELRTNRNQYKITKQERAVLATQKIGVIGLSVGKSVSLTLAVERTFGEIRLADFDILELSNLNRIQTGLHNLGVSKAITTAREIAEIDPFLKVVCFTDGLTEANMDDFFMEGGRLDMVIEVCDSLDIKILSRNKAKALRIPLIMDTSDRGMIDIERYDLEPQRSLLHGFIDHLDISKVKEARTNEEKVPYLLPMLGIDTTSTRMKASMVEIEQTITTWPQLASGVALGGAITTDVCRRIALDQLHDSGRYFIDLEELIADKDKPAPEEQEQLKLRPSLTEEEMLKIIGSRNEKAYPEQADLTEDTVKDLIKASTMAPTGANIQPWKWIYKNRCIYLFFDDRYSAGLLDWGNTTSFVGLGAATENLVLKAHELGLEVITEKQPLDRNSKLVSIYRFFNTPSREIAHLLEPHICDELVDTIPKRLTSRVIGKRQPIERYRLDKLSSLAKTVPGADLKIIDDPAVMDELREITAVMDRIRVMHKGGHRDFLAEIRWTPEQAREMQNGVDLLGTVDLTPSELAGWRILKDWPVVKCLNDWNTGSGLEKIQRKSINASSALGLLTVPKFSCDDFYTGGRAMERIWLAANRDNISVHPASLSVLIFNTLRYGDRDALPENMRREATEARKRFNELFAVEDETGEVLLFRFFFADPPKSRAVRYPVEKVLKYYK